jgi:hypothetical protein
MLLPLKATHMCATPTLALAIVPATGLHDAGRRSHMYPARLWTQTPTPGAPSFTPPPPGVPRQPGFPPSMRLLTAHIQTHPSLCTCCLLGRMEIAHVTSAALDENAKPGRHVVKIIPVDVDGSLKPEVALGTLELGRTGGCCYPLIGMDRRGGVKRFGRPTR